MIDAPCAKHSAATGRSAPVAAKTKRPPGASTPVAARLPASLLAGPSESHHSRAAMRRPLFADERHGRAPRPYPCPMIALARLRGVMLPMIGYKAHSHRGDLRRRRRQSAAQQNCRLTLAMDCLLPMYAMTELNTARGVRQYNLRPIPSKASQFFNTCRFSRAD